MYWKRSFFLAEILIIIIAASAATNLAGVGTASPQTKVCVDPSTARIGIGEEFTAAINITDVVDLHSFEIILHYNTSILDAHEPIRIFPPFDDTPIIDIDDENGVITIRVLPLDPISFNGSMVLCTITFQGTGEGSSILDIGEWDSPPSEPHNWLLNRYSMFIPHESYSGLVIVEEEEPSYELTARFYSFFDGGPRWEKAANDVYSARWHAYGDYKLVSGTYPVMYVWYYQGRIEEGWYYTVARLNVTGREMSTFNIDNPYFIPTNLLGGAGAVVGGTADLDYYVMYPSLNYCRWLDSVYEPFWTLEEQYDGWIVNWNGTVTMDPAGTKKILGLSDADYASLVADPQLWWQQNGPAVENAWDDWLDDQGNNVYDIYCFYEDYFWGPGSSSGYFGIFDLDLSYNAGTQETTITVKAAPTWGFECLMARWLRHSGILRGYEYWFSDIIFNATLGPSTSNVNIDLCSEDFMHMWGEGHFLTLNNNYPQTSTWLWEPTFGDSIVKPSHPSEFEAYADKTRFNPSPGQGLDNKYMYPWRYADWVDYDYTPAAWDLAEGESLIFDFKNTWEQYQAGEKVWIYTQLLGWANYPNETMNIDTGYLELGSLEPWPETLPPGVFDYSDLEKTLTLTGAFNMTEWSWNHLRDEWYGYHPRYGFHPEGNWSLLPSGPVLPRGIPYIHFRVRRGPGDLTGEGYSNIFDLLKIRDSISTQRGHPNYNPQVDIATGPPPTMQSYGDGFVNIYEFLFIRDHLGEEYPDP